MGWVSRTAKSALAAAGTITLATGLALVAAPAANATPYPTKACDGNGTSAADISFGTIWYDSPVSAGWRIITQGWAVPANATVVVVASTDQSGHTSPSEISSTTNLSNTAGMLSAETTTSSINANSAYSVYVAIRDGSGTTIACSPWYDAPNATTYVPSNNQTPIYSQYAWQGNPNPYLSPSGAFFRTPSAPTLTSAVQAGSTITVTGTILTPSNWSSVQYTTDGGTTWADATVTTSALIIVPGSYRTTTHAPTITLASSVHTVAGSVHQAPLQPTRTLNVSLTQQSSGAAFGTGSYSVQLRGVNRSPNGMNNGNSVIYGTASTATGFSYLPATNDLPHTGAGLSPALPIALVALLTGVAALGITVLVRRRNAQ